MADQTHVLFVEDDDVIREATQLALERDGFAVTAMPDGLSGLEAFRADRPDIALLDVMVPGLDGVSLCRRIRDESTVPVIMRSLRDIIIDPEAPLTDQVRCVSAIFTLHAGMFFLHDLDGDPEEKRQAVLEVAVDLVTQAHQGA